jgi:type IV secretory pathway ATPase VirB11/archaellum biosynthesis ATPase
MAKERNYVVSARIPATLAERLVAETKARGIGSSDVIREALEAYFSGVRMADVVVVQPGHRVRVLHDEPGYETANPVVTDQGTLTFAPSTVALGG